jgi:16S rRNA (guanine966-N2)-methyltransferase
MFNMVGQAIKGARVLDLFAGSGSMGIEAMSRGASSCVMVESHRGAIKCLKENLNTLGLEDRVAVSMERIPECLSSTSVLGGEPFDLVLIDPPFDAVQRGEFLNLENHIVDHLNPEAIVMVRVPEMFPKLPCSSAFEVIKERRYGISVVIVKRKV